MTPVFYILECGIWILLGNYSIIPKGNVIWVLKFFSKRWTEGKNMKDSNSYNYFMNSFTKYYNIKWKILKKNVVYINTYYWPKLKHFLSKQT